MHLCEENKYIYSAYLGLDYLFPVVKIFLA